MSPEQRSRALRLAKILPVAINTGMPEYGGQDIDELALESADLLRELAGELRNRTEQDAFEDWLEKECPSGDVYEVQMKWEASEELAEFLDEQRRQAEQERVPLTGEKFEEFVEQFRWYDGDVDRYDIQGFARELLRAHGIV